MTLALGNPAAGATTDWVTGFTTSVTGGLSQAANSRITVRFPTGTTFASYTGGSVFDVTSDDFVGSCSTPVGPDITCSLFGGAAIAAGDRVEVTFSDVTNPSSPGPYTVDASTTSDLPPVTSGDSTGNDTTPPNSTINSGPSGPTNDATPTFTFSSNEIGSTFECKVDSGSFATCASPFTPAAALGDGAHTFTVRRRTPRATPTPRRLRGPSPSTRRRRPRRSTPARRTVDDPTPTFEFSSGESGSHFECSIDSGPFSRVHVALHHPGVAHGTHTFDVRAIDGAGNVTQTFASRTFTVAAAAASSAAAAPAGRQRR